jgi:putative nucleotidyltransferase with HDIG domain
LATIRRIRNPKQKEMKDKHVDLRAAILDLDNLPAMPLVAQKILRLPLDTLEGEKQLLKLIERDPQISARIIGLANSPLFGTSRKITSIPDASLMLGVNRIKSVSVGIAVMSTLNRKQTGQLNIQNLWLHSLGIAMAMCVLARAMPNGKRPPDDEVFFAGLLHDIGFMVLNHIDPERSNLLQSRLAAEPDRTITEIEAEVIDIGHGELGAQLAKHWALPDDIVAVLRYHHAPDATGADAGQPYIALINLAEKLWPSFGIFEHVGTEIRPQDWLELEIEPLRIEELAASVREQAELARQVAASY